jgi:hypothetical protein
VQLVDQLERRLVVRPLVEGDRLDVPADEPPHRPLDRVLEPSAPAGPAVHGLVERDRPDALRLGARSGFDRDGRAAVGASRLVAADLVLQAREKERDVDPVLVRNPCRNGLFGSLSGHRRIV